MEMHVSSTKKAVARPTKTATAQRTAEKLNDFFDLEDDERLTLTQYSLMLLAAAGLVIGFYVLSLVLLSL